MVQLPNHQIQKYLRLASIGWVHPILPMPIEHALRASPLATIISPLQPSVDEVGLTIYPRTAEIRIVR